MGTAKFNPSVKVEYLIWNDNPNEMKVFCKDSCKISYEYASGIGVFLNMTLYSDHGEQTVPNHSYVVKIDDGYYMCLDQIDFNKLFVVEA